jgi:OmcA/MtrC family decaheme c-type cytochrome
MLVSSHTRDAGALTCYNDRSSTPLTAPKVGCRYEIAIDGNPVSTLQTNRLFTVMADSRPGAWHVTADLAGYVQPASTGLAAIPTLITDGKTKKAEIAVLPALLNAEGEVVALNAQTKTFDLVGKAFVSNYFQGTTAPTSVAKCNACHDALGTTFHEGSYGGSVTLCRTCHVTTSGGAHLEMQSRGIDSYAHAIHKFQAFDLNSIDFTDKVFAKRYALHIEHGFPNFTIKNCEACHVTSSSTVPVTYNPPDNTKSLPGLESPAYTLTKGWVNFTTQAPAAGPRNIGKVPALVTGPASRACGGCHKAVEINEDNEARLASFNSHMSMGGYNVENDAAGTYVYRMIDRIMTFFK